MTNKEYILKISSKSKSTRILKIMACIHKEFRIQTFKDLVNIIVPAKDQENKISIIAHHDLYPGSAGYNDNSSGVVTLLKLQEGLPDNVELVFTDTEEVGGQGCRYYLESALTLPKEAINVDVVGLPDKIFYEMYAGKVSFPIPESMELYPRIPFSDSRVLEDFRIPNILVLTGKSKENLIQRIFEVQHYGVDDFNIDVISEEMMDKVLKIHG